MKGRSSHPNRLAELLGAAVLAAPPGAPMTLDEILGGCPDSPIPGEEMHTEFLIDLCADVAKFQARIQAHGEAIGEFQREASDLNLAQIRHDVRGIGIGLFNAIRLAHGTRAVLRTIVRLDDEAPDTAFRPTVVAQARARLAALDN